MKSYFSGFVKTEQINTPSRSKTIVFLFGLYCYGRTTLLKFLSFFNSLMALIIESSSTLKDNSFLGAKCMTVFFKHFQHFSKQVVFSFSSKPLFSLWLFRWVSCYSDTYIICLYSSNPYFSFYFFDCLFILSLMANLFKNYLFPTLDIYRI